LEFRRTFGFRVARQISDFVLPTTEINNKWVIEVISGQRPDSVPAEELVFVKRSGDALVPHYLTISYRISGTSRNSKKWFA
jgi:hypothetical protein